MKKIITISILTLSLTMLAGCSDDNDNKKIKTNQAIETPKEVETIEKLKIEETDSPEKAEIKNLYNELNLEYLKQKDNFDRNYWINYGDDFKNRSNDLSPKLKTDDLIVSNANIKFLHFEYLKSLEGKDSDPQKVRNEITEALQ